MRDQYMRTGKGFLIVYDVTSRTTFEEVVALREQIYRVQDKDLTAKIPIVLCGNKCDLPDKQVTTQEGQELAKSFGVPFRESSAKSRINVDEVWFDLVREVRNQRRIGNPNKKPKKKRSCKYL
eukprot:TRINITY_DN5559_c0_g1_i2.p1 TRINITY_DN5559_c0_g1~~TRINITY_DN5559_c0_g1_i2.p1  ORF type:complete len:123 (+),score=25.02 TRINITY_DN5559_c0_g1_i2:339-707(+)